LPSGACSDSFGSVLSCKHRSFSPFVVVVASLVQQAGCGASDPALAPPTTTVVELGAGAVSGAGAQRAADAKATAPASEAAPTSDGALSCVCGVLDFESDGPPKGRCSLRLAGDGGATLESTEGQPRFSATLAPKNARRTGERAHYAYEGAFDFACSWPWCGRRDLDELELEPHDLRVVVERSDDGPPSHVLWVTCRQATRVHPSEAAVR
jgi:hypothetical protein